ncbi:MAG: hypothetical protein ACI4PD_06415 [Butyricicoccus sp.]
MPDKQPMTQEEYLEQVACDMPGGKAPSRIKSILLLAGGAAALIAVLLVCRALGLV